MALQATDCCTFAMAEPRQQTIVGWRQSQQEAISFGKVHGGSLPTQQHRAGDNGTFVLQEKVSIDLDQRSVRIGLLYSARP
jgi:hypothetical protein